MISGCVSSVCLVMSSASASAVAEATSLIHRTASVAANALAEKETKP